MDASTYIRFVASLALVVGLMLLVAWAVRRFGLAGLAQRPHGARRRLQVLESAPVDARRRLVLVRRDGTEHLLLVGGGNDLVVEGNIAAAAAEPEVGE
ncbi:flagellar biosynthetic protein FliO [Magnetospirillum sp. UT-4]|uniref:flagellar biosynthetic protein FliO n=1 Tax=Magnetospirillum sp. UT-4 TaxID=2681467 RepID=UPI00138505BF|nr:flagellar biosynthetic protein FliO [Magnetospirillum sp. UT-4]CAA7612777.1 conserved exported hypothetical protein [Magnetospirillum sp. UT-4]